MKKTDGIDWAIHLLNTEHVKKRRSKGVLSPKKKLTDKQLYVCPTCVCAWESVWWDGQKRIRKYNDFPTIGKLRKECGCRSRLNRTT